jgi:hypothetical protein
MNVFTDTVSISAEDLASMAALEAVRVYHRSLNVMQISNAGEGQICMVKTSFILSVGHRPTFRAGMWCPCERPYELNI